MSFLFVPNHYGLKLMILIKNKKQSSCYSTVQWRPKLWSFFTMYPIPMELRKIEYPFRKIVQWRPKLWSFFTMYPILMELYKIAYPFRWFWFWLRSEEDELWTVEQGSLFPKKKKRKKWSSGSHCVHMSIHNSTASLRVNVTYDNITEFVLC